MGYILNSTCFLFPVASSKPLRGPTVADNLTPLSKSESQTELLTLKWETGHARDLDNQGNFCHCMSGLNLNCWPDSIRLRFSLTFSGLLQNSLANGIVRSCSRSTEASSQCDSPQWITFLTLADLWPWVWMFVQKLISFVLGITLLVQNSWWKNTAEKRLLIVSFQHCWALVNLYHYP